MESWTEDKWIEEIEARIEQGDGRPLELAEQAVERFPQSGALLNIAAFAAILEKQPNAALTYFKRLNKHYIPSPGDQLCRAIALAQQGRWPIARTVIEEHVGSFRAAWIFCPPSVDRRWLETWVSSIRKWQPFDCRAPRPKSADRKKAAKSDSATKAPAVSQDSDSPEASAVSSSPLPRLPVEVPVRIEFPNGESFAALDSTDRGNAAEFQARAELAEIGLLKGFDEIICLSRLTDVERHWYQIETVRKVLRQFRGRVLLADEVGLGKTIEAGMILKEYLLRGMVKSALILTPSTLVGQWQEEMAAKFGIQCLTTNDPMLQRDPASFWSADHLIASIATARRESHAELIRSRSFDLIIVDEAHHLKNRATQNWKLVDGLQKRFLLLLSAIPVQNNLVELYNILTLLKPGIFKTEKEFRNAHMTPGNPRVPANREKLQDLMRDVMIRNTRSLVDVRLPPRHAATIRVEPGANERQCYQDLDIMVRDIHRTEAGAAHRLSLRHLLEAAGSSPSAAACAIRRFGTQCPSSRCADLLSRYEAVTPGAKVDALLELVRHNPEEKKIVFVRLSDTLACLDRVFRAQGLAFVRFDGSMSGPEKDAAIAEFRDRAPLLLSTESGGEGRNIQFCNTLINFDLPWNPQTIEQRIGRVHRIGQTRDVFVFNLVAQGTIEEGILRILDEKINMFELVVGEIQSILGELEDEQDFAHLVFSAWAETTVEQRDQAFEALGDRILKAKQEYLTVKTMDDELFGEEFEVV